MPRTSCVAVLIALYLILQTDIGKIIKMNWLCISIYLLDLDSVSLLKVN